jgi:L-threonylcarbamoyladenylate synthase
VAIPTETVYGLAALALESEACRAIFAAKGRPLVDPLIVHTHDLDAVRRLADCPPLVEPLAEAFWPGPLTIIMRKRPLVPDIVTAGRPTVAIRMPRHPVCRQLLAQVNAPLAAPSANPFGYVSPSTALHVAESFGAKVPFVLDGGPCEIGLESTILDITDPGSPRILRPGAIGPEQLASVIGKPVPIIFKELDTATAASAPGMFLRHYSPNTPLLPFKEGDTPKVHGKEAVLLLAPRASSRRNPGVYWLSENGDSGDMARSLFALLRRLDQAGYAAIHCELPDRRDDELRIALRDRILRAANRTK